MILDASSLYLNYDIIQSLWPANSVLCVFDFRRIEGASWCKNSVQIFSTLQKNCSTLFWRRQDRFWESVLREASDLVRASGCGESRNGGRWVSQTIHIHPGHVGKRGTPAWGHIYVRLPYQGSGQELPNLGYIMLNLGHTLPNLSQKLLSNLGC